MPQEGWFKNRLFQGIAWTVLCGYMVVQILASFGARLTSYDGAIPLVAADLMLHGRKAAVNFWSFYPPLYYYLILAGFRSVGRSALVPILLAAAIYIALIIAAARFFWKSFPHLRPLTPLVILPTVIAIDLFTYPAWPGYAVSFLSLLVYMSSRNGPLADQRWIALAGLLAGLSTLMRFNFGPYVLFVACADILVHELINETSIPATVRLKRSLLQVAILVIPFVLTNVVFYAWIYGSEAVAAPARMIKDSMSVMGVRAFQRVVPSLPTLICLGFPCAWMGARNVLCPGERGSAALIAGAGAILLSAGLLAGRMPSIALWFPALGFVSIIALHQFVYRLTRPALCVLLFYVGLQHYYLSRADHDHAFVLYPVVAFSLIFLLETPTAVEGARVYFRKGPIFAACLAVALFQMALRDGFRPKVSLAATTLRAARIGVLSPRMPDRQRLPLIDASLSDEVQSAEFVRQRTSPSDPIFIGVNDHSMPFTNDVRAYWLAERLPGVRYVHLDSAMMFGESAQQEIIAELQRNGVHWAILYNVSGDYDSWFPNLPPAPKTLDNFLAAQFREEARFGRFSVIRKR